MRSCQLCQKSAKKVAKRKKTRSKYNPVKVYFQQPNLQWFKVSPGKKIKICTDCRKLILKGKVKV